MPLSRDGPESAILGPEVKGCAHRSSKACHAGTHPPLPLQLPYMGPWTMLLRAEGGPVIPSSLQHGENGSPDWGTQPHLRTDAEILYCEVFPRLRINDKTPRSLELLVFSIRAGAASTEHLRFAPSVELAERL